MVVLCNTGKTPAIVLWSFWETCDDDYLSTWPWTVGNIKVGEIAFVLDIALVKNNLHGAKICTQTNMIGWVSIKCLKKIVIPVGVDPTPP